MAAVIDLIFHRAKDDLKVGEVTINDDGTFEGTIWPKPIIALTAVASKGLVKMSIETVPAIPANPDQTNGDLGISFGARPG